jgi:hypothetical protein
VSTAWTVKDKSGNVLDRYVGRSRLEVGRKVVPDRYDAFRLQVSSSYRAIFERAVAQVLEREHWKIVPLPARGTTR